MEHIAHRLTSMAHGGGCGCKLSPQILHDLLRTMPRPPPNPDLLVGTDTADDAAVWRLNPTQAIIATTDFFTPIVDDPFHFGQIAATNALSDVYAMGGTPLFALAILGLPIATLPLDAARGILAGGAAICASAGIAVIGGHSIDSPEPIYGLAAIGAIHPDHVLTNAGAKCGDSLVLTKGLGVGILSAALKKDALSAADYATLIASTTQLNFIGAELAGRAGIHAVTDVTGFGLLGHLLEMCRGANLAATISLDRIPILPGVQHLALRGHATGAATRNWNSYGREVSAPTTLRDWQRTLLCDPQTSGGLLIALEPELAETLVARCHEVGFLHASIIGRLHRGDGISIEEAVLF